MRRRPLHVEHLGRRPRGAADQPEHAAFDAPPAKNIDSAAKRPPIRRRRARLRALVVPGLDRVRPAELVQPRVGGDELLVDPAVGRRGRRSRDHLGERRVDADLEAAPPAGASARRERATGITARRGGDHQTRSPSTRIGKSPSGRRRAASPARDRRRSPTRRAGSRRADARASRGWEGARRACLYT